jgi:hypothetical protein
MPREFTKTNEKKSIIEGLEMEDLKNKRAQFKKETQEGMKTMNEAEKERMQELYSGFGFPGEEWVEMGEEALATAFNYAKHLVNPEELKLIPEARLKQIEADFIRLNKGKLLDSQKAEDKILEILLKQVFEYRNKFN